MAVKDSNTRISVKVSNDTKEKLEKLAKEDKRTISNFIEVLLEKYLNDNK